MVEIKVRWPRNAAHTLVTSVQREARSWTPSHVYIGMEGKSSKAFGITTDGYFGKPWACVRDPRGWRYAYAEYLLKRMAADGDFVLDVRDLHGQVLVCWCKGSKTRGEDPDCHGDLLAMWAERLFHATSAE